MSGKTNIQIANEKARTKYEREGVPPLIQQACQIHQLTIREFAKIFGISNAHAQNIIKHKVMPSLELAIAITRYFECFVEEMFAWRVDDDGKRCPLLQIDPKTGKAYRLSSAGNKHEKTMDLIREKCYSEGDPVANG